MNVKTRIAPSPTGRFHIGTARTALFNYLFAHHQGGTFVVRIEDTDKERSTSEYEKEIIEGLEWLGLKHDEFARQSEQAPRHQQLLEQLVAEGKAYVSKEESKNEPGKTVELVRLKNPGTTVTFTDVIRGDISFDTTELGDLIIARSVSDPLYHFAVVVDDMDTGITHVIRGEDHISNTPRQILIQEALGATRPVYAHLPLILNEKRAKLSKRDGVTAMFDYRDEGFLPEAVVNYLGLLGWNPGDEREDFSLEKLCAAFTLEKVHKGGAIFDREKLLSVNQRWMRKLSDEDYIRKGSLEAADPTKLLQAVPLLKERAKTFTEARELLAGELSCLFSSPRPSREQLLAKGGEEATKGHLEAVKGLIQGLGEGVDPEGVKAALMPYADGVPKEEGGRGAVLWPLRYALSGLERSPDPFTLISILGKEESGKRIDTALGILG
jgi:glutamyl-tRNA synthetase